MSRQESQKPCSRSVDTTDDHCRRFRWSSAVRNSAWGGALVDSRQSLKDFSHEQIEPGHPRISQTGGENRTAGAIDTARDRPQNQSQTEIGYQASCDASGHANLSRAQASWAAPAEARSRVRSQAFANV